MLNAIYYEDIYTYCVTLPGTPWYKQDIIDLLCYSVSIEVSRCDGDLRFQTQDFGSPYAPDGVLERLEELKMAMQIEHKLTTSDRVTPCSLLRKDLGLPKRAYKVYDKASQTWYVAPARLGNEDSGNVFFVYARIRDYYRNEGGTDYDEN